MVGCLAHAGGTDNQQSMGLRSAIVAIVHAISCMVAVSTTVKAKVSAVVVVVSLLLHERWVMYRSGAGGINLHWDTTYE